MELDSFVSIIYKNMVELTVREIFAAVRDAMIGNFDEFPTKEEAKNWLIYDADEESILNSILYISDGDIVDTDILEFTNDNFSEFYEYAKETNI